MITIYEFDSKRVFTGNTREITEKQGAPMGWTRLPVPEIPEGHFAKFMGTYWSVLDEYPVDPPAPITTEQVDVERDRRVSAGFTFEGVEYQSRPDDMLTISGAAQMGFMAIVAGSPEGNLRWADPDNDFEWIAADNSRVKMDAQTVVELGKKAAAHKSKLVFKGNDLKQLDPIPQDYTNDAYWV